MDSIFSAGERADMEVLRDKVLNVTLTASERTRWMRYVERVKQTRADEALEEV